jgi:4-carboxymuconolactone decarboxylase
MNRYGHVISAARHSTTRALLAITVACGCAAPGTGRAQAAAAADRAPSLQVIRSGQAPAQPGPTAYFTGIVHVRPLIETTPGSSMSAALVSFEKGARAAWHTHPLGQRLVVVSGTGRVQQSGQPAQTITQGDVVFIPAGVKHWHGASPSSAMAHIAMQQSHDGRNVDWLEKVTDAEYATPVAADSPVATAASGRGPYADISPSLDRYTRDVLFGEVWESTELSKRDRSLTTVAALVAGYRMNELPYHLKLALQNGVTKEELTGLITHLAFYAGWPSANSAVEVARTVFAEHP